MYHIIAAYTHNPDIDICFDYSMYRTMNTGYKDYKVGVSNV